MVWTSGIWTVSPGQEAAFVEAWGEFARWSQETFPGAHAWLLRDRDEPNVFMSIGPWSSDEDVAMWRNSLGFRERVGHIRGLVMSFEPHTLDEVFAIA
jgi:heme-degrading monooxygenase HmoA